MNKNEKTFTKSIVIDLPRVYNRGPPPRMILTPKILEMVGSPKINDSVAYNVLYNLYVLKKFPQSKIGKLFDVQYDTVTRWLKRLKIKIRERTDIVSEALITYKRTPFSQDNNEKAYLLGLRYGDISAQKHGRHIRVSVGTNHPSLLYLFKSSFEKYSKVNFYPKYNKLTKLYYWSVYVDLDNTFNFLLHKNKNLPNWIMNDEKCFYAFLSGYFDCEGCLSICYSPKNKRRGVTWVIKSTDNNILKSIVIKLNFHGYHFQLPRLAKKAGSNRKENNKDQGFPYRKNYWVIQTCIKSQIMDISHKINLKHEEKKAKFNLFKELMRTNWQDADKRIILLRDTIKNDVKRCMITSKHQYNKISSSYSNVLSRNDLWKVDYWPA